MLYCSSVTMSALRKLYCLICRISDLHTICWLKRHTTGKHLLLTLPVKAGQKESRQKKILGAGEKKIIKEIRPDKERKE